MNLIQSIPDSPHRLLGFIVNLLSAYGYLVVFVGAALDNYGLPSSGDIVMFAGGWVANSGERLLLPWVMLSGFLGATLSDNSIYWIGRFGGRPLIGRVLKIRLLHFLINEKSLEKAERYFAEHGGKTVVLGRFGPGLRSMTPLFAGVSRMKYYRFLPYSLLATTSWALISATVGFVFGEYWDELLAVARSVGFGVVALMVLAIAFYVYRRRRSRRKS